MFKAKIIETQEYYRLRKNLMILSTVIILFTSAYQFVFSSSNWIIPIVLLFSIPLIVIQYRWNKKILDQTGRRKLEISTESIRVINTKSLSESQFDFEKLQNINFPEVKGLPQENLEEITKDLKGESTKTYVSFEYQGEKHRYDFLIDSYYMIVQYNKIRKSLDI